MTGSMRERGFALAGAVFALVVIGVLVTGAFFVAQQESNIGKNSATYERAFQAAEAGMTEATTMWYDNIDSWNNLAVGDSTSAYTGTLASTGGSYQYYIRRLNDQLFLIRATGSDPTGASSRTLATVSRLAYIEMNFQSSLTTRGAIQVGGNSLITGTDANPSSWSGCDATSTVLPGIMTTDPSQVSISGCKSDCVQGSPDIQQDVTISDSTFFKYGDQDWNDITSLANKEYTESSINLAGDVYPRGTSTTCTRTTKNNWGEPLRTGMSANPSVVEGCISYFPIIYFHGDVTINGGRGQGILLVGGDLSVQGGFEFFGPVIVRGKLKTSGTGGHFNGGVMAANVELETNQVLGDAQITYSSCAIETALEFNAPGRPLASRAWMEVIQ